MPTAAIRGRSFSPPFAKSSGKSTWRSSSAPTSQRALPSCPSDGSSNAPSRGSTAAAAWPRIGSASTERPWRSCAWPQFASCSESSVKKQHDPGQTLRLALQLQFLDGSESMGDHDSGFDDWWSVGRRYADAVGFSVERGQATDSSAVYAGSGRDLGWTVSRWTVEQRGA